MTDGGPPLVSVVITTKNEERHIENCLQSLLQQTYDRIEIIVVDNSSSDRTKEIAHEFTDLVFDHGPERSAQRNYGMLSVASGQYVMYLDADMIPSPDLIEACVTRMSAGGCVALYIPEVVLGRSYLSRVRRFERSFYHGTVIDAARIISRETLCQVGGFDETMTGVEDWDLDKKIKQVGRIALLASPPPLDASHSWELAHFVRERGVEPETHRAVVFHNESEIRLLAYLKKKSYYAMWFDEYARKWGRDDPDVKRQLGPSYRYITVFVESTKWKRLAAHPVLTAGMYALRCLVGGMYVSRRWRVTIRSPKGRDNTGKAIERYAADHPQFGGTQEISTLLARALCSRAPDAPVLDVGCGEGGTLPALRRAGRLNVLGCDLSQSRAAIAQERGFPIAVGDALQLPIADDSIGLAVSRHVIEHLHDDLALLREIRRLLSPSACIYLETPLRLPWAWYPYKNECGEWMLDPTHVREYRSVQEVLDLFADAGLAVDSWSVRRIRFPLIHGLYRLIPALANSRLAGKRWTAVTVPVPRYREIQVLGHKALNT